MSFILDALKKSETDRQRQNRLESAYIPDSNQKPGNSRWLTVAVVLLAVNVLVLTIVLLRPANEQPAQPVEQQIPPSSAQPAESAPTPVEQEPSFREMVSEAKRVQQTAPQPAQSAPQTVQQPPVTTSEPVASTQQPAQTYEAPAETFEAPAETFQPPPPATAGTASEAAIYKTFNEARAEGLIDIPDLRIDIHVYADSPTDRFVFINMNRYKERSTLSEGPVVTEIVPEGVVMEYGGTRFLLPRE